MERREKIMAARVRAEISMKNKYWIPKHRYYELKHYCLQYPYWIKKYASVNLESSSSSIAVLNNILAKFILMGVIVGSIAWLITVLIRLVLSIFKRGS